MTENTAEKSESESPWNALLAFQGSAFKILKGPPPSRTPTPGARAPPGTTPSRMNDHDQRAVEESTGGSGGGRSCACRFPRQGRADKLGMAGQSWAGTMGQGRVRSNRVGQGGMGANSKGEKIPS